MADAGFMDGFLDYRAETMSAEEVVTRYSLAGWDDGYLAFSSQELRLGDSALAGRSLADLLAGRVAGLDGIQGYLMEVALWTTGSTRHEEVSIERDDVGFFVQRWELCTNCPVENVNCHYREARTFPRKGLFGGDSGLGAIEVVVPSSRLNFFITTAKKTG